MRRISPNGLSHGCVCHFQISHPWHDVLFLDHMIGQEKLVAMKGRTEPLFPQCGGVALYQWMQLWDSICMAFRSTLVITPRRERRCRFCYPVRLSEKGVCW